MAPRHAKNDLKRVPAGRTRSAADHEDNGLLSQGTVLKDR
jgi:hypothetical protein